MFIALVIGLPAAVWSHLSLKRDLEKMEQRCRDCALCRAKEQQEQDQERQRLAEIDRRYRR